MQSTCSTAFPESSQSSISPQRKALPSPAQNGPEKRGWWMFRAALGRWLASLSQEGRSPSHQGCLLWAFWSFLLKYEGSPSHQEYRDNKDQRVKPAKTTQGDGSSIGSEEKRRVCGGCLINPSEGWKYCIHEMRMLSHTTFLLNLFHHWIPPYNYYFVFYHILNK